MSPISERAADLAANSLPEASQMAWRDRLLSVANWKQALYDVTLWFIFGMLITTLWSRAVPGYPILVGTASITPGMYWVDKSAHYFQVNDYVSFPFRPGQQWLKARYGEDRVFTKRVKGVAGDVVSVDNELQIKICHSGDLSQCEALGSLLSLDSKGRPLTPWVPANQQYTLQKGELWLYGENPRSLDSRYYGPVYAEAVYGKAIPVFLWQ